MWNDNKSLELLECAPERSTKGIMTMCGVRQLHTTKHGTSPEWDCTDQNRESVNGRITAIQILRVTQVDAVRVF